jgi:hypothetical protein
MSAHPTVWRRLKLQVKRAALESETLWRFGFNLPSTLAYRRRKPVLTAEGRRIIASLDRDGIAMTSIDRLCSDRGLYDELLAASRELVRIHETAEGDEPYTHEANYLGASPLFDPDSVYARFAVQDDILSIINAYFGMYTQLRKYALFRNGVARGAPTVNQEFHRDGDYRYFVMRIFVYLADVDEHCGPFTYCPGTHMKGGGKGTDLKDAAGAAPIAATGPAGTIVFADTRGLHRGGRCTAGTRFFYNAFYTSPTIGADYFTRPPAQRAPRTDARSWALSPPQEWFYPFISPGSIARPRRDRPTIQGGGGAPSDAS